VSGVKNAAERKQTVAYFVQNRGAHALHRDEHPCTTYAGDVERYLVVAVR
jgi:hypothetical protein